MIDDLGTIYRSVELDGMIIQASFPNTEVGRDLAIQWIITWIQCLLDQGIRIHQATRFQISGQDAY